MLSRFIKKALKKAAKRTAPLAVVGLVFAATMAFSASSASAYGQCGGAVSNGSAIYKSWQAMGVVSQAQEVVESAGFHRMDGSLKSWMKERVVKAKLASSASPVDYGCQPGNLFSVGKRTQAKGTPVLVALPLKYAKTDIRSTPHKGYKRIVVSVHIVGKTDCSNPESGVVRVVFYIKIKVVKHHPKKHHKKPHKKKPAPECSSKSPNGGGGNCVQQEVTVKPTQECGAENHSTTGCTQTTITIVNNCGNVDYESSGNVNQGGNCNSGGTETCVGQGNCTTHEEETCVNNSCNVPPPPEEKPCGCKPKEPEEPEKPKPVAPKVELETINDFETNEQTVICARVTAPAGDSLSVTFYGGSSSFANHGEGKLRAGTSNEWCDTLTVSSEPGTAHLKVVVMDNTTGLSGEDEKSAPIKAETF